MQSRQHDRPLLTQRLDRLPIRTGSALVRRHLQQRARQSIRNLLHRRRRCTLGIDDRLRHPRPDGPKPIPGRPTGGPFRVFCCRDRQAELHRRFFDRDRLPLPTDARPGALSGHYTRLPVLRGPRTSAGPSAFVLSFSGLPNLGTQQISRGETLRFRRDRVATTPPARQVPGIAAAGQLAQPRNALRRFTFVRDHNASMASFRPALTEARQPNQPPASRPVNSGPRPCLFDVGFPLSGLQDRIHTSDLNVRARHTCARPAGSLRSSLEQPK